jgi:hypothetical protein
VYLKKRKYKATSVMTHIRTIQRCVKMLAERYNALLESDGQVVLGLQTVKASHLDRERMPGPNLLLAFASTCNSLSSAWSQRHAGF